MDYQRIYDILITRGKSRKKVKNDKLHRHRIVPGHEGGKYIMENITLLTDKEHQLVHRLRWKLFNMKADAYAYRQLKGRQLKRLDYSHSDETKFKMSIAHKGHSLSEEAKQKLRLSKLGHIVSEDTREKLRKANLGKKASKEARQNMRLSALGKNKGRKRPDVAEYNRIHKKKEYTSCFRA